MDASRIVRTGRWALPLALIALTGCSSLGRLPSFGGKEPAEEAAPPTRMAVIWTYDIITVPGQPPTRGFGGRVYFYDEKNRAVPITGSLTVFGYDDSTTTHEAALSRRPHREFRFTAEQMAGHKSDSPLGASYSIWLPWEPVGGPTRTISLLPVLKTAAGQIVMGQQSMNVLKGRGDETVRRPSPRRVDRPVQPASWTGPARPQVQQRRMQTTSITVPRVTQRRLESTTSLPPKPLTSMNVELARAIQARVNQHASQSSQPQILQPQNSQPQKSQPQSSQPQRGTPAFNWSRHHPIQRNPHPMSQADERGGLLNGVH